MPDSESADINTYYKQLTDKELEEVQTLSTLLFAFCRGVREEAAIKVSEFAPTFPCYILLHLVDNGLEDTCDPAFVEKLLVLHRCRWLDLTKTAQPDEAEFTILNKRLLKALSFDNKAHRLTADLM